jgi:hypothetical protein
MAGIFVVWFFDELDLYAKIGTSFFCIVLSSHLILIFINDFKIQEKKHTEFDDWWQNNNQNTKQ